MIANKRAAQHQAHVQHVLHQHHFHASVRTHEFCARMMYLSDRQSDPYTSAGTGRPACRTRTSNKTCCSSQRTALLSSPSLLLFLLILLCASLQQLCVQRPAQCAPVAHLEGAEAALVGGQQGTIKGSILILCKVVPATAQAQPRVIKCNQSLSACASCMKSSRAAQTANFLSGHGLHRSATELAGSPRTALRPSLLT